VALVVVVPAVTAAEKRGEQISVKTGLFGVTWAVNHHFHTKPVAAVPEPTTAALLSLGLLGLGMAGRKRPNRS